MNIKIQKLVIALAVITALTLTVYTVPGQNIQERQSSDSLNFQGEGTIEGVWRTVVTPRNCQTGAQVAPSIQGLFTFNKGGTMSEYGISTGQGQTPALRSPGHGVWERLREHEYSFKFIFYRYNASGVFLGTQIIRAALELGTSSNVFTNNAAISASRNVFTTNSAVEIFDAGDNLIGTGCATAVGRRFE